MKRDGSDLVTSNNIKKQSHPKVTFKMGSVDIVLPSRDSARIARTFILTVQR